MKVDHKQINAYKFRTYAILFAMSISIFVIAYNTTALINALPILQHKFNISPSNLQWLLNTYILASVAFMLIGGKLYDTFDKRNIFIITLFEYLVASLIIIYAPNSTFLYLGRSLQGVGAALIASGSLAIIKKTFLDFKLQKAISIWSTIAGSGFCIGPFLGGYFTSHFSWTYIFWAAILLVIISILLVLIFLPKEKKNIEKIEHINNISKFNNLDIAGIIFIVLGLICVVYSFVKVNDLGWSSPTILILFFSGLTMLIIFYFIEQHATSPILDFTTFKNKEFSLSLIGTLSLFSIILMEIPYLFNIYAQNSTLLNYSAYYAGCALLPLNICYIVGSFLSSKVTKHFGHYYTLIISLILQVIGIFMISYFVYYISYIYFIAPFIIIGLGAGMTFPCYSFTAIHNISKDKIGQASSIFNLTTYFGDLTGTVIWSIIFFYSGSQSLINNMSNSTFLKSINKSTINNLVMGSKSSIGKLLSSNIPNKKIIIEQIEKSGIAAFSNAMFYSAIILLIILFMFAFYSKKNKGTN